MQYRITPHKFFSQQSIIALSVWLCLACIALVPRLSVASDNATLWQTLGDGSHFAMIRHALAPGFGDPDGFKLRDCATQRNLDDVGREQAKNIGNLFRSNGIASAAVYSSQWCRCLDTAELMALGKVREMPAINSFFQQSENRQAQLLAFDAWLHDADLTTPTILVTHQVMISSVTRGFAASGEIVIVKRNADNSLVIVGRIETL